MTIKPDFSLSDYLPRGVYSAAQVKDAYATCCDTDTGSDFFPGAAFRQAFCDMSREHVEFFTEMLRCRTAGELAALGEIDVYELVMYVDGATARLEVS